MAEAELKRFSNSDSVSQLSFNIDSRPREVERACKLELDNVVDDISIPDFEKEEHFAKIIRNHPLPIAKKRAFLAKYIKKQSTRQRGQMVLAKSSTFESEKAKGKKAWHNFTSAVKVVAGRFTLWGSSIKQVEGNFGSAIASTFVFLRWLFFLNLIVSGLLFIFVILPEIFIDQGLVRDFYEVESDECAVAYIESIDNTCKINGSITDCVENFLAGEGWIEETLLFYGTFVPDLQVSNLTSLSNNTALQGLILSYNRPVAYVVTTAVYLLLCLVIMLRYAMSLLQRSLVYSSSDHPLKFSTLVLTGWDFNIYKSKNAKYKKRNLHLEFETSLENERMEYHRDNQPFVKRLSLYAVRAFIHFLVTISNLSAYYLIYYTTQFNVRTDIQTESLRSIAELGFEWLPSVTVTLLNNALPNIFTTIVQYEVYTPSMEVNMNVIRTSFLKLASLLVLLLSLYNNISCPPENMDTCGACGVTETLVLSCWETVVGQEFYKLTVVDLLSSVATVYTWQYPRKFLSREFKWARKLGNLEFELSTEVLDLVNSQAISWIGAFFCPFLPLITTVKFFTLFYVRKWNLLHNLRPSGREARASQSTLFFVVLLIITFLLCLIPVVYAVVIFEPSRGCGPFRGVESVWNIIYLTLENSENEALVTVYGFIGSTTFVIVLVTILIFSLIYQYNQAASANELIDLLKKHLKLEKKTKYKIIQHLRKVRRDARISSTSSP